MLRVFILTVSLLVPLIQSQECPSNPEIIIEDLYPNVTSGGNKSTLHFSERIFAVLKCSSQKPILWDFAQDHSVNQWRYIQPGRTAKDPLDPSTICFETTMFLYTGINATGKYTCREFDDKSKESSIYLFIEDSKLSPLAGWQRKIVIENPEISADGWLQIPCKTSNPFDSIELTKNGTVIELESNSLRWNNQQGFFLNTYQRNDYAGKYHCQSPKSPQRRILVEILRREVTSEPNINLHANTREATCEVPVTEDFRVFVFKKCNNLMECLNAERRTPDNNAGDELGADSICDDDGQSVIKRCKTHTFHSIPNEGPITVGLLQCKAALQPNSVSVSKYLYQFYGLSGQAYAGTKEDILNIQNIATVDIMSLTMDPALGNFYVGQEIKFECRTVAFIFATGVEWAFKLRNGTLLSKTRINYTSHSVHDTRQQGFKISNFMTIKLPTTEIESVICLAPLWNSNRWINTSKEFTVQESTEPVILQDDTDKEKIQQIYSNSRNASIICSAQGVPKPTISWRKVGSTSTSLPPGVKEVDIPVTNKFRTDGEDTVARSMLVFPTATKDVAGEYNCTAFNYAGLKMKKVKVDVVEDQSTLIGIILGSVFAIILLIVIVLFLYRRLVVQKRIIKQILSEKEVYEFFNGNPDQKQKGAGLAEYAQFLPYKKEYEIASTKLQVDDQNVLGSGQYGMVYKAMLVSEAESTDERTVAVKTVKPGAEKDYLKALLSEIKIMIAIGKHTNIVEFIGALTENIRDGKLMIVVEFCGRGSLEKYLRDNRKYFVNQIQDDAIDPKITKKATTESAEQTDGEAETEEDPDRLTFDTCKLVKWACDIAAGMEYLAEKKVIHADLACRNVLIDKEGFLKITDFGLSRQLYENMDYVKKSQDPLPWRWMSIESIRDMNFSVHSDCWSYGVTVWELFSLGAIPYPGYNWDSGFLKQLEDGLRPEKPAYGTTEIYNNMLKCWDLEPENRPAFAAIRSFYRQLLASTTEKEPNSNYVSMLNA